MIVPGLNKGTQVRVKRMLETLHYNQQNGVLLDDGNVLEGAANTALRLDERLFSVLQDYTSLIALNHCVQNHVGIKGDITLKLSDLEIRQMMQMGRITDTDKLTNFVKESTAGLMTLPDILLFSKGEVAAVIGTYYQCDFDQKRNCLVMSEPCVTIRLRVSGDERAYDPSAQETGRYSDKTRRDMVGIKSMLRRCLAQEGIHPVWIPGGNLAQINQVSVAEQRIAWQKWVERDKDYIYFGLLEKIAKPFCIKTQNELSSNT